jgi:hypothetical protein
MGVLEATIWAFGNTAYLALYLHLLNLGRLVILGAY